MKRSLGLLAVLLVSFSFIAGCGDPENVVIQPTTNYEPTAEEKRNAEKTATSEEAAAAAGDNSGFSGN